MATILVPVLFMVVGALIFAYSVKAAKLGDDLFLAGALILCYILAHHSIHF